VEYSRSPGNRLQPEDRLGNYKPVSLTKDYAAASYAGSTGALDGTAGLVEFDAAGLREIA
jgi:hypothetical protein